MDPAWRPHPCACHPIQCPEPVLCTQPQHLEVRVHFGLAVDIDENSRLCTWRQAFTLVWQYTLIMLAGGAYLKAWAG